MLCRYARRGLANVLKESTNEEFKQTVLMLKMIETNLIEEIRRIDVSRRRHGEDGGDDDREKADAQESQKSSCSTEVQEVRETMAEVIHKLNQVAEGQLRLEAQTSRMGALHKIPELMHKVEHVVQGLERLNVHSNHGDTLHAIPALKRATSVQASLAHAPPSRVGKQVESAPSGDRTSNRARSRVTIVMWLL